MGVTRNRKGPLINITKVGTRKILGVTLTLVAVGALAASGADLPTTILGLVIISGFLVTNFMQIAIWRTTRKRLHNRYLRGEEQSSGTLRDGITRNAVGRVKAATTRLWGGFEKLAVTQLTDLALNEDEPSVARGLARLELARWHGAHGDAVTAYIQVLRSRIEAPVLPPNRAKERTALEVDFAIALGNPDEISKAISGNQSMDSSSDSILRQANASQEKDAGIRALNKIYVNHDYAPIHFSGRHDLAGIRCEPTHGKKEGPLVSVIMPAYNAQPTIAYALRSILSQTWRSVEVIVVDDNSTDETVETVESVRHADDRITLVRQPVNGGPYIARNAALERAQGEFVTVHDADDWAHPEKIQAQVELLLTEEHLIGNATSHVRVTEDLQFRPPTGRPRATKISMNFSSLMVRARVFKEIGQWDEVRTGGDSEFRNRILAYYGEDALRHIDADVPLSLSLSSENSLVGSPKHGQRSLHYVAGSRRLYADLATAWHASTSFRQDLPLVPGRRPFQVPQAIEARDDRRIARFDVVIMSHFGLPGGTTSSNIQEIIANQRAGLRTGLVHHPVAEWNIRHPLNPSLLDVLDPALTKILSVGDEVTCDLLIIRLPKIGEHLLDAIPNVRPKRTIVVMNQTPDRAYGNDSVKAYDLSRCVPAFEERYGPGVEWYPIGPLVRQVVTEHHSHQLAPPVLSETDWVNIIDPASWRRAAPRPTDGKIRIGRHSRDVELKWPEDEAVLRKAYPGADPFEIHVLGGAEVARQVLGELPENWVVHDFGSIRPEAFLEDIDIYSYYTHSGLVEAFGRGLLEALAVGVPIITSNEFQPLLGDAAIYAPPAEVEDWARQLMSDRELYMRQVARGFEFIERNFSYQAHVDRVKDLIGGSHLESTRERG